MANMILESRLENLRRTLDELSATVDDNLRTVLHHLTCDDATAHLPLKNIDAQAHTSRETCLLLMTREHPVASDLKYAMVVLRIGHDYERIQELAEALQKRIEILRNSHFKDICQEMTGVMADILSMHEVLRKLWRRNQPVADLKVLEAEQVKYAAGITLAILNIQNKITNSIAREHDNPESVVEIVLACRHLKRIADTLQSIPEELRSF